MVVEKQQFMLEGRDTGDDREHGRLQQWSVDHDYINTLSLNVNKGRGFSPEFPSDSSAVILNQTAVDRLGLGEDPIGERIKRSVKRNDQT